MRSYRLGGRWSENLNDLKHNLRKQARSIEVFRLVADIAPEQSTRRIPRLSFRALLGRRANRTGTAPQPRRRLVPTKGHLLRKGAIGAILTWTEYRMKTLLPSRAWDGRTFQATLGNASCHAICQHLRLRSTWSFRLRVLDDEEPRLSWNVETVVDHRAGSSPSLTLRIYFETADDSVEPTEQPLTIPGFVRQIASEFGLRSGTARLTAEPTLIRSSAEAHDVASELLAPSRKFTAIVLIETHNGATASLTPSTLAKSVAGIAKVFVLPEESATPLSNALGHDVTADGAVVRAYSPGLAIGPDSPSQLRFRSDELQSAGDARSVSRWLENYCAAISLEQFELGRDLTPFDQFRERAAKHRGSARPRHGPTRAEAETGRAPEGLASGVAEARRPAVERVAPGDTSDLPTAPTQDRSSSLGDRAGRWYRTLSSAISRLLAGSETARLRCELAERNAEVRRLNDELNEARDEVQWLSDEHAKAERVASAAQSRLDDLEPKLDELQARLRRRGDDPDIPLPASWSDFADWSDEHISDRLQLHWRARREVRSPRFKDVGTAARALVWLATHYRDYRIEGKGGDLRGSCVSGLSNERCGSDSFLVDWNGRKVRVQWHIKNTNTMDPERCLRIYYFWDDLNRQVVVASMPGHVP